MLKESAYSGCSHSWKTIIQGSSSSNNNNNNGNDEGWWWYNNNSEWSESRGFTIPEKPIYTATTDVKYDLSDYNEIIRYFNRPDTDIFKY